MSDGHESAAAAMAGDSSLSFSGRENMMYLSTIPKTSSLGAGRRRRQGGDAWERKTNDVSDIRGAKPKRLPVRTTHESFFGTGDISGATPSVTKVYRKPNTFDTSDIPGASSVQKKSFASTKRRTNPLNPDYPLPKAKPAEYPVPKFLRDSLRKDDIPFASSGEHKKQIKPRETMKIEIEGAQAGWKPFSKRVHNGKNYEKYYEEKVERTSKRHTDPQNPSYRIYGQVIDQKSVTGNPKPIISGHNGNLRTNDIDGAITGTIRYTELDPAKRRHFRVTNQTKDIRGAQADTLRRGLKSNRVTHPLRRDYPNLHGRPFGESPPQTPIARSPAARAALAERSKAQKKAAAKKADVLVVESLPAINGGGD